MQKGRTKQGRGLFVCLAGNTQSLTLARGAHSNDNEYIHIDSIEPRLYLATRLIMDVARGRVD
jgi:hypothetical protein